MASTNKTKNIGLSLWELGDKPGMEDFNADNRKLEEALTENEQTAKALQTALEQVRQSLQTKWENVALHGEWTTFSERYLQCAKTATGMVHVFGTIKKSSGVPQQDEIVAVLPEAYKPKYAAGFVSYMLGTDSSFPMVIHVDIDGNIKIESNNPTDKLNQYRNSGLNINITFPAAQ